MTAVLQRNADQARADAVARHYDPTRTLGLRNTFVVDMNQRFARLKRAIRQAVANDDVLGLAVSSGPLKVLQSPGQRAYAFQRADQKIESFMRWLAKEEQNTVLGAPLLKVVRGPARAVVGSARWTDIYIESAYKRGIERGLTEATRAGYATGAVLGGRSVDQAVSAAFFSPTHADKVAALYTRTFNDLKGITAAMDTAISRSLAEGLAEGRGPRQMAQILTKRVNAIGLTRARTLARTEVVRAHHVGNINALRSASKEMKVQVMAEWSTAGDELVCEQCSSMENQVFELDVIESMIPLHPRCRCVAIPAKVGEGKHDKARAREVAEGAVISGRGVATTTKTPSEVVKQKAWVKPASRTEAGYKQAFEEMGYSVQFELAEKGLTSDRKQFVDSVGKALGLAYSKLGKKTAAKVSATKKSVRFESGFRVHVGGSKWQAAHSTEHGVETLSFATEGVFAGVSSLRQALSSGHFVVNSARAGDAALHELGHLVDKVIGRAGAAGMEKAVTAEMRTWTGSVAKAKELISKGRYTGFARQYVRNNVSDYGATDSMETWAEAFCAYFHPEYGAARKLRLPKRMENAIKELTR